MSINRVRWKWVPGFEGLYMVSNAGEIMGTPKKTSPGHILATTVKKTGYVHACLSKDGKKHHVSVHRVVAQAFIPNPHFKPEVNHKNGDRSDNRAENLEWATRSENERHAYRVLGKTPTSYWAGKPRRFARRFTDEEVRAIRADERTCTEIGSQYGVSKAAIQDIKRRKNYKKVK